MIPTADNPVTHLVGDALGTLRTLPSKSVNTCITSPPYYGLRDYGTALWDGGSPGCDHRPVRLKAGRNEDRPTFGDSYATHGTQLIAHGRRHVCAKCGATKTDLQIGLERSPEEYIARQVEVFRELHRVLRDDGTLWLNLGDSYATKPNGPNSSQASTLNSQRSQVQTRIAHAMRSPGLPANVKHKDLLGIPWSVALALRDDGWYLRQDVIWAKAVVGVPDRRPDVERAARRAALRQGLGADAADLVARAAAKAAAPVAGNPQPESARDRCTKAHEYLFLLTKSPRYYFDAAAIAEAAVGGTRVNGGASFGKQQTSAVGTGAQSRKYARPVYTTRNRRSVWFVPTKPFRGAHFATFPRDLIRPCVLASCPPGGVVLDPFAGSGTTLQVARQEGRLAVGIELNPKYHELIRQRLAG